jgi:hypothetical protein
MIDLDYQDSGMRRIVGTENDLCSNCVDRGVDNDSEDLNENYRLYQDIYYG